MYRKKNIELIAGEMGHWLEVQLPDDIEERQFKENITQNLGGIIEEDRLSGIEEDLEDKILMEEEEKKQLD